MFLAFLFYFLFRLMLSLFSLYNFLGFSLRYLPKLNLIMININNQPLSWHLCMSFLSFINIISVCLGYRTEICTYGYHFATIWILCRQSPTPNGYWEMTLTSAYFRERHQRLHQYIWKNWHNTARAITSPTSLAVTQMRTMWYGDASI